MWSYPVIVLGLFADTWDSHRAYHDGCFCLFGLHAGRGQTQRNSKWALESWIFSSANVDVQFIAPIGIGLALFIAQLVAMPFTGASLNPARSFGAAVATHHFPGYHWIYWIGPLAGSALAAGFYKLVKVLEAETALAMRGDNVLGHRHRISNGSAVPAGAQTLPAPLHTLDPVAEQDVEKGLPQAPLEGVGKGNAQQRYVSDPEDATAERGSPKSSSAASLPSMIVIAEK